MILKNCDFRTFLSRADAHSIYCYGAGQCFENVLTHFGDLPWEEKLCGLIDRDAEKQGTRKRVMKGSIPILSLVEFIETKGSNAVLLITCRAYSEVVEQLNQISALSELECYIYDFMWNRSLGYPITFLREEPLKIPPVIHYCWFGRNPLPDQHRRYMDSWRKFCPDYRIVEWNEDNCDIGNNLYAKQAYEAKKYGFVPDYFRLKIIYENGGIYLDTDVELLKNLDDLRHEEAFCGLQLPGEVGFGLGFGAAKGHPVIRKMMKVYENMNFLNADGTYNLLASSAYQTADMRKLGLQYGNRQQRVAGMCVYPTEVLSPLDYETDQVEITENSYAIHHFSGSWLDTGIKEKADRRMEGKRAIADLFA